MFGPARAFYHNAGTGPKRFGIRTGVRYTTASHTNADYGTGADPASGECPCSGEYTLAGGICLLFMVTKCPPESQCHLGEDRFGADFRDEA